ncbi:hypothetical protein D3C87_2167890 [compost metagenome]
MKELLYHYLQEKQRLDELGRKSLEQGIPLGENEPVQIQQNALERRLDIVSAKILQHGLGG